MFVHTSAPSLHLTPQDRGDVETVARDRFQSERARRRARSLLSLAGGHLPEEVPPAMIESLLKRYRQGGVQAALFGTERRVEKRVYDVNAVADVLRELVTSRPPAGVHWSLKALHASVESRLPDAAGISQDWVRTILVKRLGIRSVRHIEPYWLQRVKQAITPGQ